MLDLECIPERSLTSDTWEFILGMNRNEKKIIQKNN